MELNNQSVRYTVLSKFVSSTITIFDFPYKANQQLANEHSHLLRLLFGHIVVERNKLSICGK